MHWVMYYPFNDKFTVLTWLWQRCSLEIRSNIKISVQKQYEEAKKKWLGEHENRQHIPVPSLSRNIAGLMHKV